MLDNAGVTFRIYRNTLFVVAFDPGAYAGLERFLRRFLALQEIAQDKSLSLTASAREEVQKRLKDAEKDLPFQMIAAYRHVGWYGNGTVIWRDVGLPTVGEKSLSARVFQNLKSEERVLSLITPKLILERAFGEDEEEKSVQEICELFLKTPGLPCLESENVLVEAVKQGVRNRLLGVRMGAKVYFDEAVSDVSPDSLVLRPEKAAAEKRAQTGETAGGETTGEVSGGVVYPPGEGRARGGTGPDSTAAEGREEFPAPHRVTRVAIKAAVPWDKLSHIVTGVIRPLKGAGSDPEIVIEIKAESAGGFDRTTLDTRVRETLLQLGAEIKEFDVE